jgi:HrpA-like RNA helicase
VAERVAEERGEPLGKSVGYQVQTLNILFILFTGNGIVFNKMTLKTHSDQLSSFDFLTFI